tara:strand:+ start:984 stop:1394 length:411 start_codon:yes stop_codon:yes gene_type:complete
MKMYSLKNGCDLLESLLDFAKNRKIQSCWIFGIGALKQANIAWYNQKEEKYEEISISEDLEIVSLSGNISLKSDSNFKDDIFPHFHISLSDKKGQTYGGHVLKGCKVFVCEFMVMQSLNQKVRFFDKERGLWLWHD